MENELKELEFEMRKKQDEYDKKFEILFNDKRKHEDKEREQILCELALQLETALVSISVKGTQYEEYIYYFSQLFELQDSQLLSNYNKICDLYGCSSQEFKETMMYLKKKRASSTEYKDEKINIKIINEIATIQMEPRIKMINNMANILKNIRKNDEDLFLIRD